MIKNLSKDRQMHDFHNQKTVNCFMNISKLAVTL